MEDWEVEENTNINVLEETKKSFLKPFEYAEAHVNVLDEVPQSYSHKINLELDQTRYITKTKDHEFMDLEVVGLLSRICAFYEEKDM
jgi:predicted RNA-binding protein Jag